MHVGIKRGGGGGGGIAGENEMQQFGGRYKNREKHLTITQLVSLPKTLWWTTTGYYIINYTLWDRNMRVSRVLQSIKREAWNMVQEPYILSALNCSNVLGVLFESCDGMTPNIAWVWELLACRSFFAISESLLPVPIFWPSHSPFIREVLIYEDLGRHGIKEGRKECLLCDNECESVKESDMKKSYFFKIQILIFLMARSSLIYLVEFSCRHFHVKNGPWWAWGEKPGVWNSFSKILCAESKPITVYGTPRHFSAVQESIRRAHGVT